MLYAFHLRTILLRCTCQYMHLDNASQDRSMEKHRMGGKILTLVQVGTTAADTALKTFVLRCKSFHPKINWRDACKYWCLDCHGLATWINCGVCPSAHHALLESLVYVQQRKAVLHFFLPIRKGTHKRDIHFQISFLTVFSLPTSGCRKFIQNWAEGKTRQSMWRKHVGQGWSEIRLTV